MPVILSLAFTSTGRPRVRLSAKIIKRRYTTDAFPFGRQTERKSEIWKNTELFGDSLGDV